MSDNRTQTSAVGTKPPGTRMSENPSGGKQVTAGGMTYVVFDMAEVRADLVRRIDHSGVKPRTG